MYSYIKGKYISSGDSYVIIETGGIGYIIYTSLSSIGKFTGKEQITAFTYLYLREGIMDLYGFATEEERSLFLNLISVSGVGPKAATSILSVATPEAIAVAIITGDSKLIQKAQGVGPKVAQRVVMELKDKLKGIEINTEDIAELSPSGNKDEALNALLVLGFSENDAKSVLKNIDASLETELIIKEALKAMA